MNWTIEKQKLHDGSGAETGEYIAYAGINKPESANAMDAEILAEGTDIFLNQLGSDTDCRVVVIYGEGKHFCAGANLNWMKESSSKSRQENLEDANKLTSFFESIIALPMPSLSVVKGAAYGGGVGIIAATDFAIVESSAKICLSEVKIGLIPSVILPYLGRKISPANLNYYGLTGELITADKAVEIGLAVAKSDSESLSDSVHETLKSLVAVSGNSQQKFKELNSKLYFSQYSQGQITAEFIADIRASDEGKAGLQSFMDKNLPSFKRVVKDIKRF